MGWLIIELIKLKWLIRKLAGTGGGSITGGANVGTGTGLVYKSASGGNLNFRSLKAGPNITITTNTNDITIEAVASGEVNTASNTGTGVGLFRQKVGVDLQFKSIESASSKISVFADTPDDTVRVGFNTTKNSHEIYIDVGIGSDITGDGSKDLPYKTLPMALSTIHDNDNFTVVLGPGHYTGEPIALPHNVRLVSNFNADIEHELSYTALPGEEGTMVFVGIGISKITFDLALAGVAIPTFYNCGIGNLIRTDPTLGGPQFIRVFDSSISTFSIKGTALFQGVLFIGGGNEVLSGGQIILLGDIQGTGIDIYGTATIVLLATVFSGSITGHTVGPDTPSVLKDASSSFYGGSISGANVLLIDSASNINNTPAGTIVSTNVQAAINELDSEKVATASNVGVGEGGVFKQKTGIDLEFRTLKAGANISISEDTDEITIEAASSGESNTASNTGAGVGVFKEKVGVNLEFKSLTPGSDKVVITNDTPGNDITFDVDPSKFTGIPQSGVTNLVSSLAAKVSTASNVGPGIGVFRQKSGTNLEFKSLTPGSSRISITNDTPGNDIVIDTTAEANTASNTGAGVGVFRRKVGVNLEFKSLSPGSDKVVITNDTPGNDITFDVDPSKFTGIPQSGVTNLVTNLAAKVSTASNVGPGIGVFRQKSGTNLEFKSLTPGSSKIVITNDTPGNDITIDTTAEINTASNTGSGIGVFRQKVGVDLQFKTLAPGSDKVTIANDTPGDRIDIDVDDARFAPRFYRSMMFG